MDRHEYKRQNEERDARKKAKAFEKTNAESVWYRRRPKWWHTPSDRFNFLVASATTALAIFAIWQLLVMRGQLDAMERDQQPYVSIGDKLPAPRFEIVFRDKGVIEWAWNVTNFGKGEARETTIDAFLKIGDGPFKRTPDNTGPGWVGEIPSGRSDNGLVRTEPIYSEADFSRLNNNDFAIGLLLEIQYVGLNNKRITKSVCISKFARGGMGIADPENCKKSKEK